MTNGVDPDEIAWYQLYHLDLCVLIYRVERVKMQIHL